MSQFTCLQVLRSRPLHWFNTEEIAKLSGSTVTNVSLNMCKLRRWELVDFQRSLPGCGKHIYYRFKDIGLSEEWFK